MFNNVALTDPIATSAEELNFKYKNCPGLLSILPGYMIRNGAKIRAIEIHAISHNVLNALQSFIGVIYNNIPVNYLKNTVINAQLSCGDAIINISENLEWGTLGCLVKRYNDDSTSYIMSCCHVLGQIDAEIRAKDSGTIGKVVDGKINDKLDVGFAELIIPDLLDSLNGDLGIKAAYRSVSDQDALVTQVSFTGISGNMQNLTVYNDRLTPQNIRDPGTGQVYVLDDLFNIARLDQDNLPTLPAPSSGGDSGSVIIDGNGVPLGIVVGGDKNFTYAVKLSNIFDQDTNAGAYPQYYIPI